MMTITIIIASAVLIVVIAVVIAIIMTTATIITISRTIHYHRGRQRQSIPGRQGHGFSYVLCQRSPIVIFQMHQPSVLKGPASAL